MKSVKFLLAALSGATLCLTLSACSTTTNNSAANAVAVNKSNTATVVSNNQTTMNNTATISNTTTAANSNTNKTANAWTPAAKAEGEKVKGELQTGKTESVILYFGEESGDYAGYCFANDSEAGRAILAQCKDKEQCEVVGKIDGEAGCKVPGLEADLSASGKITKVASVKSLGRKK